MIEIALKNREHADTSVTVVVSAEVGESFSVDCDPFGAEEFREPTGAFHKAYSSAVRAACLSGAVFARRLIGVETIEVHIHRARGIFRPQDVEGFAVAVSIAAAFEVGRLDLVDNEAFAEWDLVRAGGPDSSAIQRPSSQETSGEQQPDE